MGLGSVGKKAKSTVSKVAKKASPEQLKQQTIGDIKQLLSSPKVLGDKLSGLFEKLGISQPQLNPAAIIGNIGR